jgi:hypothetical protein
MDNIALKYSFLDSFSKQEVMDFIDFLLTKNRNKTQNTSEYQQQLLSISAWDEESLQIIEQNNHLKSWEAKTW